MQQKKSINFGFRGWMLLIYQFIAYIMMTSLTNYPLNILADMYGGAQKVSMIYTVFSVIGILIQIVISPLVSKMNVKVFGSILGIASMACMLGIMTISPANVKAWFVVYALGIVLVVMYATFALGILIGQWFPTRKGTVMGIATLAFPIGNALLGPFANAVFGSGQPNVFGGYLPFFIVGIIGWLIGLIFIKDYPEQCGAYRDNDKNMTPEIANKMLEEEIENRKTTVWKIGHTFRSVDFWLLAIPEGFLLMYSVGVMTQTSTIIEQSAMPIPFSVVMLLVCIVGCIGSYVLGLIDTKLGTKKSMLIALIFMILSGILGAIPNGTLAFVALMFLAVFMGAGSNYNVSAAAQYWRREDFSSVYALLLPVANIIQAVGPMIIAMILFSKLGYTGVFIVCAVFGVIGFILLMMFKPDRVKKLDDKFREAAGKPLDDALVGRK